MVMNNNMDKKAGKIVAVAKNINNAIFSPATYKLNKVLKEHERTASGKVFIKLFKNRINKIRREAEKVDKKIRIGYGIGAAAAGSTGIAGYMAGKNMNKKSSILKRLSSKFTDYKE